MMRRLYLGLAALLLIGPALSGAVLADPASAAPTVAGHPAECLVEESRVGHIFPLPRVAKAVAGKKLDILVLGSGSSTLPGKADGSRAYPARLQSALSEMLPGVTVKVATEVKSRRTAAEMVKSLPAALASAKPALVIWQTGTVDAIQSIDPERFSVALERGIGLARKAGADAILVNAQYSPRTESMIALGNYADAMRWVALRYEIPLFDRFGVMRNWSDLGIFRFTGAANKLDTAYRVHDCIGRLLADLIVEAVKPDAPHTEGGR